MTSFDRLSDDELSQQLQRAVASLPDAPAALQRAAIGLWPAESLSPLARWQAAGQALLTQVAAVLSFDSWVGPMLAHGMRSLRAPTRHLLFSAQGRDIDLRISPDGDLYALSGQVLGPDDTGAVQLQRQAVPIDLEPGEGRVAHHTTLDALGEFRLDGLARGTYVLTLRLGTDEIALPAFALGPAAPGTAQDGPGG